MKEIPIPIAITRYIHVRPPVPGRPANTFQFFDTNLL